MIEKTAARRKQGGAARRREGGRDILTSALQCDILFLMKMIFITLLFASFLCVFSGCQTLVEGSVHQSGRAQLKVNSNLEPKLNTFVRNIMRRSQTEKNGPVLDAALLKAAFSTARGVEKSDWTQKSASSVEGSLIFSNINEIFDGGGRGIKSNAANALLLEKKGGGGRIKLTINRKNGEEFIKMISPDLFDYLSVLLAPAATGEELSANEYLELLSEVYGEELAKELPASRFKLNLDFPARVRLVAGGVQPAIGSSKVVFDIPLLDLLVLEKEIIFEVVWGD